MLRERIDDGVKAAAREVARALGAAIGTLVTRVMPSRAQPAS